MKKIKIFILFIIIFIIGLLFVKGLKKTQTFDDFLFLKLGSNVYPANSNINLIETANHNTLINEKIAPGTSGDFSIFLNAKANIDYRLIFESINEKPINLKFNVIKGKEIIKGNSLEELSKHLTGRILKNKQSEIKIKWYWNFGEIEGESNADFQDTIDAQRIEQYKFKVYAVAKQKWEVK